MRKVIDEFFNPHIDLCEQTFNQIVAEWGTSTVTLKHWLDTFYPAPLDKRYSLKAGLNTDIFLPYRKNALWSGEIAISRLRLAVMAKVIIIYSDLELTALEQEVIYKTECLRLWCRIDSLRTKFSFKDFKKLLDTCFAYTVENWDEVVADLQDKQEKFKYKRKQTMYHYTAEDFNVVSSEMTLKEAYEKWLTTKYPFLLEKYKTKKRLELTMELKANEYSQELRDYKFEKFEEDFKLIKLKEPTIRAFAKLLKVHNIEYKKNKSSE